MCDPALSGGAGPVQRSGSSAFDESAFQRGIRETPWFSEFARQYGEEPDLNTQDYDYRKAWAAGIRPQRDPYDGDRYHWPSSLDDGTMLKGEDHPTAWKEHYMRQTGKNPDEIGVSKEDAAGVLMRGLAPQRRPGGPR